jgi:superfamily II DNA or RNA helicase
MLRPYCNIGICHVPSSARRLRVHQSRMAAIVNAIAVGEAPAIKDILGAVTPGGGKSLLPVIAAARLIAAGVVERICWVVPRDSLRLQAEEAFADPTWREALGHGLSVRAGENAPDPCRGLAGYVTTYQAIAAAANLHLAEMQRHRYLLVVDEVHHLPALSDMAPDPLAATDADDAVGWSRALLPLLEVARLRLLLSGTLERADGRGILWLPYRKGPRSATRQVDLEAPGWAVIGYSRKQALADRAVLPVMFGALDGEASWLDEEWVRTGPHLLFSHWPIETTRPALFTALRTGFAVELLREAFQATRTLRATRRKGRGLGPDITARGLGKLLVVAPDQATARAYLQTVRRWVPDRQADTVRLATSGERDAHEALAAFRIRTEPSILITVAMAYEGLDAPEVAVVAALTHIRSRPWLEQMVARATRVDPHAGRMRSSKHWCITRMIHCLLASGHGSRASRACWRADPHPGVKMGCRCGCRTNWQKWTRRTMASCRWRVTPWRCDSRFCDRGRNSQQAVRRTVRPRVSYWNSPPCWSAGFEAELANLLPIRRWKTRRRCGRRVAKASITATTRC